MMRLSHQVWHLGAVLLLLTALFPVVVQAETKEAPKAVIEQATEDLLVSMRGNLDAIKSDMSLAYRIAEDTVLPHLDFARIARWVLGKHWRTATREQRREFIDQFQEFLTRTYVTMMVEFCDQIAAQSGAGVSYPSVRQSDDDKRAMVRSVIELASGEEIQVDYRMYRSRVDWKVYDVVVGGVSLAATYRTSFSQRIDRNGFDGLLTYLASKAGH
ncbi:MAG: ABC transporter substrate-binding protein [Gammaproteobacteria bacterium]|nr:ABC transporter substrate-binding protein [Gammaproteobacteria bacterium]NIR83433.1 ABC transporter substrate-binding protein [Gammaproteobacteria bacterium]NIR91355.1 ABC transporter substrate-binding protein [Gammaproteobacteria bacterium]NIU04595.1 ABC transporter substrate-binding protein [Gammaproteobacteria bacterium]NIV51637.1 ABC transporter substrate-binding protein [Gammaproteobacteria bacterium]